MQRVRKRHAGPRARHGPADALRALPFILSIALGCGESANRGLDGEPAAGPPERIILIVADTLRRDKLSPYGGRVPTPALAKLAARGRVYTNAVSSFHQTTMSMSSLLTGRTPSLETGASAETLPWTSRSWCGMARLAASEQDTCIPAALQTIPEDLRDAGYETLGVVSNRLVFRPYGYDQGFDRWIEVGEKERPASHQSRVEESKLRTGARVNAVAEELLTERTSDRFFLYVHYIDPHDYGIRPDLKSYADGVRYLDAAVGDLLQHLDGLGLLEGAAVVFTADHGEYLGAEHALPATKKHFGNPSFDSLLRVPLIVAGAPRIAEDDVSRLVRSQDLRSLIRRIAGLDALSPSDLEPDEVFLTEQFYQTYRRGRWKSMRSRDGETLALFDLERDPGETRDVSGEHPDIVAAHRARVEELARDLGTRHGANAELSPDDEQRLRALGYLE